MRAPPRQVKPATIACIGFARAALQAITLTAAR
jgi:hypothetical protein